MFIRKVFVYEKRKKYNSARRRTCHKQRVIDNTIVINNSYVIFSLFHSHISLPFLPHTIVILFKKLCRFIEFLSHSSKYTIYHNKTYLSFFLFFLIERNCHKKNCDDSTIIKKWLAFATLVRTIIESFFDWTLIMMIDVYHTCITCISYTHVVKISWRILI